MRLASFSVGQRESYGVVTDDGVIDLGARLGDAAPDLRSLLAADQLSLAQDAASVAGASPDHALADITWLPVVTNPEKILCVGLNYEDHRVETKNDLAQQPAIFMRTAESQVGHDQPLVRPRESQTLDYEAEIAVVIGKPGRRIARDSAWDHVAGYSCYNDGTVREFQRHTHQYTPGKNFPLTGAFGPWMVTADEIVPDEVLTLSCRVNGEQMQHATTEQMIFKIPQIVEYVSTFTTLVPGDVVITGTPGGVGSRRSPQVFLHPGDVVEVEIDKVGVLRNTIVED
jgi:2-keto-4-pentenoate hydratase/2-oxohepta-3-ene-1,7-dioic acid hydratase in catechol pathway